MPLKRPSTTWLPLSRMKLRSTREVYWADARVRATIVIENVTPAMVAIDPATACNRPQASSASILNSRCQSCRRASPAWRSSSTRPSASSISPVMTRVGTNHRLEWIRTHSCLKRLSATAACMDGRGSRWEWRTGSDRGTSAQAMPARRIAPAVIFRAANGMCAGVPGRPVAISPAGTAVNRIDHADVCCPARTSSAGTSSASTGLLNRKSWYSS